MHELYQELWNYQNDIFRLFLNKSSDILEPLDAMIIIMHAICDYGIIQINNYALEIKKIINGQEWHNSTLDINYWKSRDKGINTNEIKDHEKCLCLIGKS